MPVPMSCSETPRNEIDDHDDEDESEDDIGDDASFQGCVHFVERCLELVTDDFLQQHDMLTRMSEEANAQGKGCSSLSS